MATRTLGTTAQTSLTAISWINGFAQQSPADYATMNGSVKDDLTNGHPSIGFPFGLGDNGFLYVPNRGYLRILPGDYVGIDNQGWPMLISANSIANGAWVHT